MNFTTLIILIFTAILAIGSVSKGLMSNKLEIRCWPFNNGSQWRFQEKIHHTHCKGQEAPWNKYCYENRSQFVPATWFVNSIYIVWRHTYMYLLQFKQWWRSFRETVWNGTNFAPSSRRKDANVWTTGEFVFHILLFFIISEILS